MIRVVCDHCGAGRDIGDAQRDWTLLHHRSGEYHFCSIDCVLFWGAGGKHD